MRHLLLRLWRPIAEFYQSHRDRIDRALIAAGMAALVYGLCRDLPFYPREWQVFLSLAAFVAGCYQQTLGYFASVAIVTLPLWQLSPYLAALFLAVAVLAHRPILRRLPWALLIVAAPVLREYFLVAVAPLAAGIFLGAGSGFLAGALATLWLKLAGGTSGLATDLATVLEQPILASSIAERFTGATSVGTLQRLAEMFDKDPRLALLDVIQILGWGFAGALAGWIWRKTWAREQPWLGMATALFYGALVCWAAVAVAPIVLQLAPLNREWLERFVVLDVAVSSAVVGGFYGLRRAFSRPIRVIYRRPARALAGAARPDAAPAASTAAPATPLDDEEKPGDMILLELD